MSQPTHFKVDRQPLTLVFADDSRYTEVYGGGHGKEPWGLTSDSA